MSCTGLSRGYVDDGRRAYVPSARAAREAGLREGFLAMFMSASWCSPHGNSEAPLGLPLASAGVSLSGGLASVEAPGEVFLRGNCIRSSQGAFCAPRRSWCVLAGFGDRCSSQFGMAPRSSLFHLVARRLAGLRGVVFGNREFGPKGPDDVLKRFLDGFRPTKQSEWTQPRHIGSGCASRCRMRSPAKR
jgi:hypothetical protein